MGKISLWIYALCGSGYWLMSKFDGGTIDRYAVGPLWLLMAASPVVLTALIAWPFASRFLAEGQS